MLVKSGVHRLGFPIGLDVHPEDLSEEEAAAVIRTLGLGPRAWLITYLEDPFDRRPVRQPRLRRRSTARPHR